MFNFEIRTMNFSLLGLLNDGCFKVLSFLVSGQLVVASLLKRNIRSRLLLRDLDKATKLFGKQDEYSLQVRT